MTYTQRKSSILETVDEFETRKEALAMLKECRLAPTPTFIRQLVHAKRGQLKEPNHGTQRIHTNQHRTRRVSAP